MSRFPDRQLPGQATPLTEFEPGERVMIRSLDGPEPQVARRLADLGFIPGSAVEVVRRAPLGDPTEYEVRGTRLCLRRSESAYIRVSRS